MHDVAKAIRKAVSKFLEVRVFFREHKVQDHEVTDLLLNIADELEKQQARQQPAPDAPPKPVCEACRDGDCSRLTQYSLTSLHCLDCGAIYDLVPRLTPAPTASDEESRKYF